MCGSVQGKGDLFCCRFKVGQDEEEETFVEIVTALRGSVLADVMLDQRAPRT